MNIEINSDEIITLMKQSHSDDISNTLDQIIRYCRHVQKDYIEGNSEISGIHILTELLKQGSIKPDLFVKVMEVVERYKTPYEIKVV